MAHTEYTDPVPVRRAYKFRAYPTRPQEGRAVRLLADHCDLYNAALEERREAWRVRKVSISYGMQSAQLRDIRRADPDGQGRHSFSAQQQTLRRLDAVFGAFFYRVKAAATAGEKKREVTRGSSGTSGSARSCSWPGTVRSGFRRVGAGGVPGGRVG